LHLASFFEKRLAGAIWTGHNFESAVVQNVLFHVASFDGFAAVVAAGEFCVRADISDVLVHIGQLDRDTAAKETLNYPVLAYLVAMPGQVSPNYAAAPLRTIRTLDFCERTFVQMAPHPTPPHNHLAQVIRALGRQFLHESANRDVGGQLADHLGVAEGAGLALSDALFAEQVVAAGSLDCVFEDV